MTAVRQWTREYELLHWLLVLLAAIAIALVVASVLGSTPIQEPRLLPKDMGTLAKPITPETVQPFFP
jgi:hypothetical protein